MSLALSLMFLIFASTSIRPFGVFLRATAFITPGIFMTMFFVNLITLRCLKTR